MEKPGMAAGRARTGGRPLMRRFPAKIPVALALPLFVFQAAFLYPQQAPRVIVQTAGENPQAGSAWVLTLFTDFPDASLVSVAQPDFATGVSVVQSSQRSRLVNPDNTAAAGLERWTATEYSFVFENPGSFAFGSFTVITPRGETGTEPFTVEVRDPALAAENGYYRTVWDGVPQSITAGESAVVTLRLEGNAGGQIPATDLFMPAVPPGYILESLPPVTRRNNTDREVLRMRITPLTAGTFDLPRRAFSNNGAAFEIPPLRIPITWRTAKTQTVLSIPGTSLPATETALPFPAMENVIAANGSLYRSFSAEFETEYLAALALWESGGRAESLALLRRHERDHKAGELFAIIRREAEAALGITESFDEKRGLRLPFFSGSGQGAVLLETSARKIPDEAGEETAFFTEGQPVKPGRISGRWVPVTSPGGRSGWVPAEKIIMY